MKKTREKNKKEEENKEKQVLDASGAVLGRLASYVAKKSLEGKSFIVLNCNNMIIKGKKPSIVEGYLKKRRAGRGVQKGPFFPRKPSLIFRRAVRGMLKYKKHRGREAFKRIKAFDNIPKQYEKEKIQRFSKEEASIDFITLKQLSLLLGKK